MIKTNKKTPIPPLKPMKINKITPREVMKINKITTRQKTNSTTTSTKTEELRSTPTMRIAGKWMKGKTNLTGLLIKKDKNAEMMFILRFCRCLLFIEIEIPGVIG